MVVFRTSLRVRIVVTCSGCGE